MCIETLRLAMGFKTRSLPVHARRAKPCSVATATRWFASLPRAPLSPIREINPEPRCQAPKQGRWKVKNGHVAEGKSLLRGGLTAFRTTGAEAGMPHYIALLAKAYEIAGQIEEGVILLDDALQLVERTGERWFAAEARAGRKGG